LFGNSKSTGKNSNNGGGVPVPYDSSRLVDPAPLLSEVECILPAMKHYLEIALDVLIEDYGQDEMMEADKKEFWKPWLRVLKLYHQEVVALLPNIL